MKLSDSYANNYLNFLLGKTKQLVAPSTVWAGLCTNDPEVDGAFTEVVGFGYSRILLSVLDETYPNDIASASNREIKNARQLAWPKATGAYTVKGIGLFTSASQESNPVPFAYGRLGTEEDPLTVTIADGALPIFEVGGFEIFASGSDNA